MSRESSPPEVQEDHDEVVDGPPGGEDEYVEPQGSDSDDYDSEEEELDTLGDTPYVWGRNLEEDVEVASSENLVRYAEASRRADFDPVVERERDAEEARIMSEQLMPRMRQIEAAMNRARAVREESGRSARDEVNEDQRKDQIRFKQAIRAIEAHIEAFKRAKKAKYERDPFDRDGTPPGGAGGSGKGGAVPSA